MFSQRTMCITIAFINHRVAEIPTLQARATVNPRSPRCRKFKHILIEYLCLTFVLDGWSPFASFLLLRIPAQNIFFSCGCLNMYQSTTGKLSFRKVSQKTNSKIEEWKHWIPSFKTPHSLWHQSHSHIYMADILYAQANIHDCVIVSTPRASANSPQKLVIRMWLWYC